ncbi:MAG: hypothetical protein LBV30_09600 [Propionibacteriaceae bacterium]|nr:hypothetical protein [Propionibacteriaceae bacterium]
MRTEQSIGRRQAIGRRQVRRGLLAVMALGLTLPGLTWAAADEPAGGASDMDTNVPAVVSPPEESNGAVASPQADAADEPTASPMTETPALSDVSTTGESAVAASAVPSSVGGQVVADLPLGPTVIATDDSVTGYAVVFRYRPGAEQSVTDGVKLNGEWAFAQPSAAAGWPGVALVSHGGDAYVAGDVQVGSIAYDMVLGDDGVYSYVVDLPSGTFSYAFQLGGDCGPFGCVNLPDPANLPWENSIAGATAQAMSQIYVPESTGHPTRDNAYQAPTAIGQLIDLGYPAPTADDPNHTNRVAVYLPVGYDANRAIPYPVLYISHGMYGNEGDWTTQGVAQYIEENAIAAGATQPFVIVATNWTGVVTTQDYAHDLYDLVIPLVEERFNIATDPSGRAFAGLSWGGMLAADQLYNHTNEFAYYGSWSAAVAYTEPTAEQLTAIKAIRGGIHLGVGDQDGLGSADSFIINQDTFDRQAGLTALGVELTSHNVAGIHSWEVWRDLLNDFIASTLFKTTELTVTPNGAAVQAGEPGADADHRLVTAAGAAAQLLVTVAPVTANQLAPTGLVRCYDVAADGGRSLLAEAAVGADGTASCQLPGLASGAAAQDHQLLVEYAGDGLYNPSSITVFLTLTPAVAEPGAADQPGKAKPGASAETGGVALQGSIFGLPASDGLFAGGLLALGAAGLLVVGAIAIVSSNLGRRR